MKHKIIRHSEKSLIEKIVSFMHESESIYNETPTSKEAYSNSLKYYFNEESVFIIIADEKDELLACASISTDKNYAEIGFLGHYHIPINLSNRPDIKKFFFKTINDYCLEQNIFNIIGPINFNTWLSNRFIYPVPKKIQYWEPNNPSQYPEDFIDEGFEIDKKYYSYFLPNTSEMEVMRPVHAHTLGSGYKMTPIDLKNLDHRQILYKLNCECFSENYFYSTITFEQYENSLLKSIENLDMSYSCFIENDERKWGYIFNLPDNETIVIKTIIVSPLARAQGLGTAMIYEKMSYAKEKGFKKITGALIREGNASQRFFKKDSSPFQINEYLLFKKALK